MKLHKYLIPVAALALILMASACSNPRIHRLSDVHYEARGASDPIDLYEDKITRDYLPLAIVDSLRYLQGPEGLDAATREKMMEELRVAARLVGADAVHKVRVLPVRARGFVDDEQVPIDGAVRPGHRQYHFMRGEAVIFMDEAEETPGPVSAPRRMQISE